MSLLNEANGSHKEEREERILQSLYDHVLRSVVVSYASSMHEMIKTGQFPASELQTPSSRQEIFPDLYRGKSTEEIQALLQEFGTEQMPSLCTNKRKLRQVAEAIASTDEVIKEKVAEEEDEDEGDDNDDDDEDFKADDNDVEDEAEEKQDTTKSTSIPTITTNGGTQSQEVEQQPHGVDIWGRIPPKEPKQPVLCTLCGRHISTSRFASHLEKCMGISTRPLAGIPIRNTGTYSSSLK